MSHVLNSFCLILGLIPSVLDFAFSQDTNAVFIERDKSGHFVLLEKDYSMKYLINERSCDTFELELQRINWINYEQGIIIGHYRHWGHHKGLDIYGAVDTTGNSLFELNYRFIDRTTDSITIGIGVRMELRIKDDYEGDTIINPEISLWNSAIDKYVVAVGTMNDFGQIQDIKDWDAIGVLTSFNELVIFDKKRWRKLLGIDNQPLDFNHPKCVVRTDNIKRAKKLNRFIQKGTPVSYETFFRKPTK